MQGNAYTMVFNKPQNQPVKKSVAVIDTHYLYPVFTAEQLLAHPKRQFFIDKVREQCALNSDEYEAIYAPMLKQFMEFVQILPSSTGGRLAGLVDDALIRGSLALEIIKEEMGEEIDPLKIYALYTLALFKDVGKVIGLYEISYTDSEGVFIDLWMPHSGTLVGKTEYYKIRLLGDQWINLSRFTSALLAKQLMTEIGFDWLSNDYPLYQMWLATLLEDETAGGGLTHLLQLVNKRFNIITSLEHPIPAMNLTPIEANATIHADKFLDWLTEGIENNSILVNQPDAAVHMVKEGLFLELSVLFAEFCKTYANSPNFIVLQKQFNYLGLGKLSGMDVKFEQYFAKYPENKNQITTQVKDSNFLSGQNKQSILAVAAKKLATSFSSTLLNQQVDNKNIKEGVVIAKPHLIFKNTPPPNPSPYMQPVTKAYSVPSVQMLKSLISRVTETIINRIMPSIKR